MSSYPSAIKYLFIFRRHVGRRLYFAFVLTLLAGVTEGLGIALLLPLLTLMDVHSQGQGLDAGEDSLKLTSLLEGLLSWLGIQGSMPGILLLVAAVFALKGLIKFTEGAYKSVLQAQLMREMRAMLFDSYSTMDYSYYSRYNTGHFINLINVQVHSLVTAFERYNRFLTAGITVVVYFLFAFMISWRFASMALVAGLIILIVFRKLNHYVRLLSRKTVSENGTLNHFLVQTLQAFKYVAATARIAPLRAGVMKSIHRLTGYMRNQGIAQAFTEAVREPLAVAVLVSIVIVQLIMIDAPLTSILVALVLIYRAMGQLVTVQTNWLATMRNIGSLEVVERELEQLATSQQASGAIALGPLQHGIELHDVCFAYGGEGSEAVLMEVNLTIEANSTVALVGMSGAGKSTLVDLLTLMLRPTRGELRIDGVSHHEIELDSWRSQIGYVSQETVVFDDTIANNISLWGGDFDTEPDTRRNVELAAARAYAMDFIDSLPEGFNTRVGDRGVRLSGGQRQRLFIARELYKNPRLLILDEATSALDSESESVIKRSIEQLKGSTTVVIIAHRLATISNVDQIYVLEKGRIVEKGTYPELIACEGTSFHRMAALQRL